MSGFHGYARNVLDNLPASRGRRGADIGPLLASDAAKLRTLADWFDVQDARTGSTDNEVQRDLRRIARRLDVLDAKGVRDGG